MPLFIASTVFSCRTPAAALVAFEPSERRLGLVVELVGPVERSQRYVAAILDSVRRWAIRTARWG